MGTVNLKQARQKLSALVDAAERGESTVITRRGKKAATIGPASPPRRQRLPDLSAFRRSLKVRGTRLSQSLIAQRDKERY